MNKALNVILQLMDCFTHGKARMSFLLRNNAIINFN